MPVTEWNPYSAVKESHTVAGNLLIQPQVYSPQLDNQRDVLVWLPQSYESGDRQYPVIYMHDGQNLFDAFTSFSGEWRVDETMLMLDDEGLEAIIVGIPNNDRRLYEYSPYPDSRMRVRAPQGDAYLAWMVETLKPMIDSDFRTLSDREHTGMVGSSMGGLISLYGFLTHGETFGFVGALSPSCWFGERAIFRTLEQSDYVPGKIYLDTGSEEGRTPHRHKSSAENPYLMAVRHLGENLIRKGYTPGETLMYVEEKGGMHNEDAWARRLPSALRFLLR